MIIIGRTHRGLIGDSMNYIERELKVDIYERTTSYDGTKALEWGVNWGGFGTKSPAEALVYADKIRKAAEIAKALNGFYIKMDYDNHIMPEQIFECEAAWNEWVEAFACTLLSERFSIAQQMLEEITQREVANIF